MELIIILSYVFVCLSGVLFHYTHKWFKNGVILHMFSAVNESTWEHMKLAFSPMFFVTFIQAPFLIPTYSNFWFTMLCSLLIAVFSIPLVYYPVRMILKREIIWVSISLYFLAVLIAFIAEYLLLVSKIAFISEQSSIIFLLILPIVFLYLTFKPPRFFLFRDPVQNKYGHFSKT